MNFLPVAVEGRKARAAGFEVELSRAPGVAGAILGIRPEALVEPPGEGQVALEMKVEVVEVLGSDQYLYGTVGPDPLTARVDPRLKVEAGDRVRLGVDQRRLHLFDPETEKALP
jgi:multiple sugar transport system ATP-binding protein